MCSRDKKLKSNISFGSRQLPWVVVWWHSCTPQPDCGTWSSGRGVRAHTVSTRRADGQDWWARWWGENLRAPTEWSQEPAYIGTWSPRSYDTEGQRYLSPAMLRPHICIKIWIFYSRDIRKQLDPRPSRPMQNINNSWNKIGVLFNSFWIGLEYLSSKGERAGRVIAAWLAPMRGGRLQNAQWSDMTRMEWTAVAKGTRATYILKFWGGKEVGQPWLYFSLCLGNNNRCFLILYSYFICSMTWVGSMWSCTLCTQSKNKTKSRWCSSDRTWRPGKMSDSGRQ